MSRRVEIMPGVFLRVIQTDKFKTGSLSINFLRPLCEAEAAMNALLPSVLLRGTQKHPNIREISVLLDELYGAGVGTLVRKKGEIQTWGFYADFIEDAYTLGQEAIFEKICCFLKELLFMPLLEQGMFTKEAVEGEKTNLCNTIAAEINNKRSYAIKQMLRTMYEKEPAAISRLGSQEQVAQITPQQLYAHYRKVLETSRVEIIYLGAKEEAVVQQQMLQQLRELPRGVLTPVGTSIVLRAQQVREKTELADVTQGKLALGFRTGIRALDPDFAALRLMNVIYGSGSTSKLFLQVREKNSLCYSVSSALDKMKGVMIVSAGIDFSKEEEARTQILQQLKLVQAGEISEEELQQARSYLLSTLQSAQDQPSTLDEFYLGQAILGSEEHLPDQMYTIARVTKPEIVAAAQKLTLDTIYFLKGAEV